MLRVTRINNVNEATKWLHKDEVEQQHVKSAVENIINQVQKNGDVAVKKLTAKYDLATVDTLLVSEDEMTNALNEIPANLLEALKKAAINIRKYHEKQLHEGYEIVNDESTIKQLVTPIEKVGMYVPGGSASYPSTVLMNALPAKIAGVDDLIMITPPNKDGSINHAILAAAKLAGVNKIYKVGGAQGIAALAYGTESIPQVSKIVGPGNAYVAEAKQQVSNRVGIDMIAGPSEVLIIADESANPTFVAADLMAQAEHDENATAILLTDCEALAKKVVLEVTRQLETLSRRKIIKNALQQNGVIMLTKTIEQAVEIANNFAPEHLEIITKNPYAIVKRIKNAGAIFIGEYSPEPVGDYYAGPNHTIPTNGTAKFSSPLSVTDFQKKTSLIHFNRKALLASRDDIVTIAEEEGLTAHANAVNIRFEQVER